MSDSPTICIPEELFACAESSCFAGTYDLATLEAGPDEYRFEKPLAWSVTITNTGDALLVDGVVSGVAKTDCARCLDEYQAEYTGEVQGYFLLSEENAAPEDMDDDEFDVLPASKEIDMKPLLEAGILLELPLIPLCKEDCKGLCSTCGENLNQRKCSCDSEDTDFEQAKNPFSALKDYSFE